jgi:hypothetical protein
MPNLPARFIQDRLERDLPCGSVVFKGRVAIVDCDATVLADIKHDAEYQGWFTDCEDRALVRSARRAFDRLT